MGNNSVKNNAVISIAGDVIVGVKEESALVSNIAMVQKESLYVAFESGDMTIEIGERELQMIKNKKRFYLFHQPSGNVDFSEMTVS